VDWTGFYEAMTGRAPRELLTRALDLAGPPRPGARAVDLGCGDGTEALALLEAGWHVVAIDSSPDGVRRTTERCAGHAERVDVRLAGFEEVAVPDCDLLYSGFSLPFCDKDVFPQLWQRIRAALRPDAPLVVNFFGTHDTWASSPAMDRMTFLTRAEVRALAAGLRDVDVREHEEDGHAHTGPKHWHVLELVARAAP